MLKLDKYNLQIIKNYYKIYKLTNDVKYYLERFQILQDFCNSLVINEGIINILKNIINTSNILSKNNDKFLSL